MNQSTQVCLPIQGQEVHYLMRNFQVHCVHTIIIEKSLPTLLGETMLGSCTSIRREHAMSYLP